MNPTTFHTAIRPGSHPRAGVPTHAREHRSAYRTGLDTPGRAAEGDGGGRADGGP